MLFAICQNEIKSLNINGLDSTEIPEKKEGPKNEGMSTEVYENTSQKNSALVSLKKFMKNKLVTRLL